MIAKDAKIYASYCKSAYYGMFKSGELAILLFKKDKNCSQRIPKLILKLKNIAMAYKH